MPIVKETQVGCKLPTREVLPAGSTFEVTQLAKAQVHHGKGLVASDGSGVIVTESGNCGVNARKFEKGFVNKLNIKNEIKPLTFWGRTIRQERRETIIWVPEVTTQS